MQRRVFVILLLASSSFAQFNSDSVIHRLRVKVVFSSGTCDSSAVVSLVGRDGPLPDRRLDNNCVAQFLEIPRGSYSLHVSGANIAEVSPVSLDPSQGLTEFEVRVSLRGDYGSRNQKVPGSCVSVTLLAAPGKAKRELNKANAFIAKEKYDKAKAHLLKAIAVYPRYAAAFNNLAVVYARLGDRAEEQAALQHAIEIDDRLSAAHLNLARMQIAAADFPAAENALNKAVSCDNGDPTVLNMLAYAQLMNRHFEDALATSRWAHTRGGAHSTVHWVAERIFRLRHQIQKATAEMEMLLKEEPYGARADAARKELLALQGSAAP